MFIFKYFKHSKRIVMVLTMGEYLLAWYRKIQLVPSAPTDLTTEKKISAQNSFLPLLIFCGSIPVIFVTKQIYKSVLIY